MAPLCEGRLDKALPSQTTGVPIQPSPTRPQRPSTHTQHRLRELLPIFQGTIPSRELFLILPWYDTGGKVPERRLADHPGRAGTVDGI